MILHFAILQLKFYGFAIGIFDFILDSKTKQQPRSTQWHHHRSNRFAKRPKLSLGYSQHLNCKILRGETLLQPWPNAFGIRKYFSWNYVFSSPILSDVQKERSSPQFGTKFGRNLWNLSVLTGSFLSDQPTLKSRWGDAKSRWGDAKASPIVPHAI